MVRALYIGFLEGLSEEYYYYNGLLLINASLTVDRVVEIIKIYLEEFHREKAAVS